MNLVESQFNQYVGECWEHLCRQFVSGNEIDGIAYDMTSRWWGKIFPEENKEGIMIELDVVAESFDKKAHPYRRMQMDGWGRCPKAAPRLSRKSPVPPVHQGHTGSALFPIPETCTCTQRIRQLLPSKRHSKEFLTR